MNPKLKRYGFRIGKPERGNVETIIPVEDHIGTYVKFSDVEPLIEALRTYASKDTWKDVGEYGVDTWIMRDDRGNEARQALKSIGEV